MQTLDMNIFRSQYFWLNTRHHIAVNQQYFFYLSPDIFNDSCEIYFVYNITPKAAILDAEDTLLSSNLDKPLYLHCNEHYNVPIPISTYDYIFINRSLQCDCQFKRGNGFLQLIFSFMYLSRQGGQKHVFYN